MPLSYFSITLLCVLGISIGQILFKKAAMVLSTESHWQGWLLNGWLISALALYGVMTLLWIWVLRHVPLHLAYPFMGLAFIIVPTLAWFFLGEPMNARTIGGGVLILAGIALAAGGSHA